MVINSGLANDRWPVRLSLTSVTLVRCQWNSNWRRAKLTGDTLDKNGVFGYLFATFVFICAGFPSGEMRIYISNNYRHFVVAEEVFDRCVDTCAAAATWRNVYVVDVQLFTIGHCICNALLLQMRIGWLRKSGNVVDEEDRVFD